MVATRTIEDYVNLERCVDALEDERVKLHHTITELLEILRRWEPDWSSGKDRRTIMMAMYQIGVLRDPTETVEAMKVGADGTATDGHCTIGADRCNCGGDVPAVRAGCANWKRHNPTDNRRSCVRFIGELA